MSDTELSWSVVTTGPYMDMLQIVGRPTSLFFSRDTAHARPSTPQGMLGPVQREDETFVFNAPIGDGHMPLIALVDLGFFARYTFDHRVVISARNLEIATICIGATWTGSDGSPREVDDRERVPWHAVQKPHSEDPGTREVADHESGLGRRSTSVIVSRKYSWKLTYVSLWQ